MNTSDPIDVCVIGSGPAGLAAAEAAVAGGARVLVAEQKPSFGRKFLMAGKSGLNLTKDEGAEAFRARIDHGASLAPSLADVGPQEIINWAEGLAQSVFTGSSGRVFPKEMKASPLLGAWLARLVQAGVTFQSRWRWTGWDGDALVFDTPNGETEVRARATVLACGGGSWKRLGSDGAWATTLGEICEITPFAPSNTGILLDWSEPVRSFAGTPIKPIRLSVGDVTALGECVISSDGLEGGAVYEVCAPLRRDAASLTMDLIPDVPLDVVVSKLSKPQGKASLSNHLRKQLRLTGAKATLLREAGALPVTPPALAARIKALPLKVSGLRPLDQAISTVGGVPEGALTDDLMLKARPGVFCAGEMIDWDAPTGGYLITTCLATGWRAGAAAAR